jgi:hypothetical protein
VLNAIKREIMFKNFKTIVGAFSTVVIVSCGGGGGSSDGLILNSSLSSNKTVTEFSVSLPNTYKGVIDEANKKIDVTLPYGNYVLDTGTFSYKYVLNGGPSRGESLIDRLDRPFTFIVKAEDGSTAEYTVTVKAYTTKYDYVMISNNGTVLSGDANGLSIGSNPTDWACTKDVRTGLIWEIKTTDGGFRDWRNKYTNFDSTEQLQNWVGGNFVAPSQKDIDAETNTIGYKTAVNSKGLCGYNDWRLPKASELHGLIDTSLYQVYNYSMPLFSESFFPNTQGSWYWTSDSADFPDNATTIAFFTSVSHFSYVTKNHRFETIYIRLVR